MSKSEKSTKSTASDTFNDFARKYRPKKLGDLFGNATLKYVIRGMFKRGKVASALMLTGPKGNGKTSVARIVATMANCLNPKSNNDPCLECSSCKAMLHGKNPDYFEMNASADNGVDDIRKLISFCDFRPQNKMRVVVLDEAHGLTKAAQNAILKITEEPKPNLMFIFCTTDPQKIIDTLASRFIKQHVDSLKIEESLELMQYVCKEESVECNKKILRFIAESSGFCPREMLKRLEVVVNLLAAGMSDKDILKNIGETGAINADGTSGVTMYVLVKQWLASVYAGKLGQAIIAQNEANVPCNIFLKMCIDWHNNVLMRAGSGKLKQNEWVSRETSEILSLSGLNVSVQSVMLLGDMLEDMIKMYESVSQFQLADTQAPITSIATKYALKFKKSGG